MKNYAVKAEQCPNCHQSLNGENYCPTCGQKNDVRRITLWQFVSESLSNTFAFDGRVFHTLNLLFRFPGRVPDEFSRGKRVRYMNPIRIYFLSSLLLLFIIEISQEESSSPPKTVISEEAANKIEEQKLSFTLAEESESASPQTNGDSADNAIQIKADDGLVHKVEALTEFYILHPDTGMTATLDHFGLEHSKWNQFLWHQSEKIATYDEKEFNNYLLSKMFWVLFLFLPILAFLLKLLYIRRDFYYPEHLFFTFYNQAVFFLLISIALAIPAGNTPIVIAVIIYGIYLFMAMRRFYRQGVFKTLIKFITLNSLSLFLFAIFLFVSVLVVFILK